MRITRFLRTVQHIAPTRSSTDLLLVATDELDRVVAGESPHALGQVLEPTVTRTPERRRGREGAEGGSRAVVRYGRGYQKIIQFRFDKENGNRKTGRKTKSIPSTSTPKHF